MTRRRRLASPRSGTGIPRGAVARVAHIHLPARPTGALAHPSTLTRLASLARPAAAVGQDACTLESPPGSPVPDPGLRVAAALQPRLLASSDGVGAIAARCVHEAGRR